jgi:hypothetical protein
MCDVNSDYPTPPFQDLHLGDTHLVGVQTSPFAPWQGRHFIALLVVLDRDASGQLVLDSLVSLSSLLLCQKPQFPHLGVFTGVENCAGSAGWLDDGTRFQL